MSEGGELSPAGHLFLSINTSNVRKGSNRSSRSAGLVGHEPNGESLTNGNYDRAARPLAQLTASDREPADFCCRQVVGTSLSEDKLHDEQLVNLENRRHYGHGKLSAPSTIELSPS
jgi:hypothetical protein